MNNRRILPAKKDKAKKKSNEIYMLQVNQSSEEKKKIKAYERNVMRKIRCNAYTNKHDILRRITIYYKRVKMHRKNYIGRTIIEILDEIIPHSYFGCYQNKKRFFFLIKKITSQSRGEYILKKKISEGYDLKSINWLQEEQKCTAIKKKILLYTNLYILDNIVKPLIREFYSCVRARSGYNVLFIAKGKWHSFQENVFNMLVKKKHLLPGNFETSRGELLLFPKDLNSLTYRPVISAQKLNTSTRYKYRNISRKIRELSIKISPVSKGVVLKHLGRCIHFSDNKPLYAVKLDVEDAFGNVDIKKLSEVIKNSNFFGSEKVFLINHIENQYVSYHQKKFKWNHGLLQGDHLSEVLCDLYLSILDREHLHTFAGDDHLLFRKCDDYLFCTTDENAITAFEQVFSNNFPTNSSKIERAGGDYNCEITFFGNVIDCTNKEIHKYFDPCIEHKYKFWGANVQLDKAVTIVNTVRFYFTHHYFKHLKLYNIESRKTIWIDYFKGMIYVALKLDLVIRKLAEFHEKSTDLPYLLDLVKSTITEHAKKVNNYFKFNLNFKLLKIIGIKAFILVFKKRRATFYKPIIEDLSWTIISDSKFPRSYHFISKYFNVMPREFQNIKTRRTSTI